MLKSDYNFGERLVHLIALGSNFISKASFEFEKLQRGSATAKTDGKHLFITGLARSGTTVLMNNIHNTGKYRSLSYLDMPFVLMPGFWKKIQGNQTGNFEKKERAHGDGILVGKDSPEAFEEVFWRVFCERDYIFKDRLAVHKVDNETIGQFKKFVNHVLLSSDSTEQHRYLSKNNNNILRLPYLKKAFPDAYIITTFRDPLQHAISLYNQHKRFSVVHSENHFALKYMSWLGHYEFGLNHKPFYFEDIESFNDLKKYSTDNINYWLLIWRNYYRYLLTHRTQNLHLFCFEDYCANPNMVLSNLFSTLGIDHESQPIERFTPKSLSAPEVDPHILNECNAIYRQLKEQCTF